jgi:HEPN domain-containing protein
MTPKSADPERQRHVRRWLQYAQDDLKLAEAVLRDPEQAPRHACLHAQQAAEKALKAGLIFLAVKFEFRHDLDRFRLMLPPDWEVVREPLNLANLTEWAVESRYPGDYPDATEDDAREAVALARDVLDYIRRDLKRVGLDLDG